jgi:hypothetical protein
MAEDAARIAYGTGRSAVTLADFEGLGVGWGGSNRFIEERVA